MLLPFNFSIITIEEANLLKKFIENQTTKDHKKMQKLGVVEIYNKLCEFIDRVTHYENELRYLEPKRFITKEEN